jgi:hypothetical protein
MITIYVRKKIEGKANKEIEDDWFDFEPTSEADMKLLTSRNGMRVLVTNAAISDWEGENTERKGEYSFNSNKVNLYVKNNQGQLEVVEGDDDYMKHADKKKFYAYVPAPLVPTTANKQGGGDDQGKLVFCGLFVNLLVCAFLDHGHLFVSSYFSFSVPSR